MLRDRRQAQFCFYRHHLNFDLPQGLGNIGQFSVPTLDCAESATGLPRDLRVGFETNPLYFRALPLVG